MTTQPCRLAGCPGAYEARRIAVIEYHAGQLVVVDGVPARVCDECGDELLDWPTVQQLEALAQQRPAPAEVVPLYHFPADHAAATQSEGRQSRASAR